jgi:uncharacterized membrane protein
MIGSFSVSDISLMIVIMVIVVYAIYLLITKQYDRLRHDAYDLIQFAENNMVGTKRGQQRFKYVLDMLYDLYMPVWLKAFISRESVAIKLQEWYLEFKDLLDDGKINGSSK